MTGPYTYGLQLNNRHIILIRNFMIKCNIMMFNHNQICLELVAAASNYDRKKSSSCLSGGCRIIIRNGKKRYSRLSGGCAIIITTGKKVLVVCLAGARSLLRPEKKSSSHLSGGCAIVITTGKKRSSCLSGGAQSLL